MKKTTSPIVSFLILYDCGSVHDAISKSGVAHYLEHMAFEFNHGKFSTFLESVGAETNAYTSLRSICFYEIVPGEHIETVFEHESQRMQAMDIDENVFLAEKGAILEERNMRYDSSPYGAAYEALTANGFNRSAGGISVIGWRSEIESLQPQDLQDFHSAWFAPNNATILIIGDIGDVSQMKSLAEKYFGGLEAKELQRKPEEANRPSCVKEITYASPKISLSTVGYIYHVPFVHKQDFRKSLALKLLLSVLNQPDSFIKKLLEHNWKKVGSITFSYLEGYFPYGIVEVGIGDSFTDDVADAEKILAGVIKKLLVVGIEKNDLDMVKKQKELAMAYKKDDIGEISQYIAQLLSSGYLLKDIQSIDETMQSITVAECNAVLREVFSPKPVIISRMIPKEYDSDL
jgi:zinc protease